jgi:hypothetical protein
MNCVAIRPRKREFNHKRTVKRFEELALKNAANGAGGQGSSEESLLAGIFHFFNFFLLACVHVV